jgi:hypothetical protein
MIGVEGNPDLFKCDNEECAHTVTQKRDSRPVWSCQPQEPKIVPEDEKNSLWPKEGGGWYME